MSGTLGPYTSASSRPTLWPSLDRASARFTAKVVFPTPPLPEPTAIIVSTPGRGCGPCGGCPGRGDIGVFKESPSRWAVRWGQAYLLIIQALLRRDYFAQHVWLGFLSHQMRIFFTAMVVELVSLVVIRVLDQQLERVGAVCSAFERVAQPVCGEALSIYRHNFHA